MSGITIRISKKGTYKVRMTGVDITIVVSTPGKTVNLKIPDDGIVSIEKIPTRDSDKTNAVKRPSRNDGWKTNTVNRRSSNRTTNDVKRTSRWKTKTNIEKFKQLDDELEIYMRSQMPERPLHDEE